MVATDLKILIRTDWPNKH